MKISWDYKDLTFQQFVSKAEEANKIKFYYKEKWVKDLNPSDFPGIDLLTVFLDKIFKDKSLYYYVDNTGNIIVTIDFAIKVEDLSVSDSTAVLKEEKYITPDVIYEAENEQEISGNQFITVGNPADKNRPGNVNISGYISDRDTKAPVAGATVFIQKDSRGTMTNEYGYFSLSLPRGSHLVQFSFVGMKEKIVHLNLYGPGEMNIEMNSTLIPLKESTISAQRNMVLKRYEVGVEKINITTFKIMPTSMGESDIIKNILLIPGVQSVGEGSAGFNVRGGSADQNLILLYGAPIYNTSHFFGFFSAVNSDIIKDVTLYKGGIPSRYGGRISSVLDITSRDGNCDEFVGNAGISPITTHLTIEGPIKKDTCSFILSARTTYSNWVMSLVDNASLKNSKASFYDINGRVSWDISNTNRIEVSGYTSHDSFKFNSDTVYSYDNSIFALRWRHFFTSKFFSQISLNNSYYRYDVTSNSTPTEAFTLSHSVNSTGFKSDFNWFMGRHEINFGLDLTRYSFLPGRYSPEGDSSLVILDEIEKQKAIESALYIDDKLILNDYVSINAGIRISSYFAVGPQSVMIYDPSFSKSLTSVTDTINYSSNKIYKSYAGPEFRLSINFKTSSKSSLKVNYNRTRQYLHLLSNSTSISPTDTWKLSDYYLKPQIGDQIALGFYQMLSKKSLEGSVEIYYKSIQNMLDYKGGTNLIMDEFIEKDLVNVKGMAYGVEVMAKKTDGKLRWSVAYTYSRTFMKSTGTFSDEIINLGKWFPANYDKPHDLVVTFNYLFSRRFSFSSNYTYSTGRPITYPIATYYAGSVMLVHYSDRNKYRIPDYSRLDLAFKVSGNLKAKKIANPYWTFSIYNLLSRENVYSIYFKNVNNRLTGYKLSVFGQAIPSVTFSFDF